MLNQLKRTFEIDSDSLCSELELDENCGDKQFEEMRDAVDFHFKLGSLQLIEACDNGNRKKKDAAGDSDEACKHKQHYQCGIGPVESSSEPPNVFKGSKLMKFVWRNKFVRPISWLMLLSFIIKAIILFKLQFEHDRVARSLDRKIKSLTPSGENENCFSIQVDEKLHDYIDKDKEESCHLASHSVTLDRYSYQYPELVVSLFFCKSAGRFFGTGFH